MSSLKDIFSKIIVESEESEDELFDSIMNFIIDLPEDSIPEEMAEQYSSIMEALNSLADDDEEEDDEEESDEEDDDWEESISDEELDLIEIKTIRIKPADKRKYKMAYKKNKAKLKMKMKKYRKSAKFKKYAVKSKRMAKLGKTSTGAKKVHYK